LINRERDNVLHAHKNVRAAALTQNDAPNDTLLSSHKPDTHDNDDDQTNDKQFSTNLNNDTSNNNNNSNNDSNTTGASRPNAALVQSTPAGGTASVSITHSVNERTLLVESTPTDSAGHADARFLRLAQSERRRVDSPLTLTTAQSARATTSTSSTAADDSVVRLRSSPRDSRVNRQLIYVSDQEFEEEQDIDVYDDDGDDDNDIEDKTLAKHNNEPSQDDDDDDDDVDLLPEQFAEVLCNASSASTLQSTQFEALSGGARSGGVASTRGNPTQMQVCLVYIVIFVLLSV